eukprot:ANDGO_01472.mRNA.1 hypothetical protein
MFSRRLLDASRTVVRGSHNPPLLFDGGNAPPSVGSVRVFFAAMFGVGLGLPLYVLVSRRGSG